MDLHDVLERIDALKTELDAARPLHPDREEELWWKLRLDWNHHNNALAGSSVTQQEILSLLAEGRQPAGLDRLEVHRIRAHDIAVGMVRRWQRATQEALTAADVCDLHQFLLIDHYWIASASDASGQELVMPGHYRTVPKDIPERLEELMRWYAQPAGASFAHPLMIAAEWHHRFSLIRPFADGNGRVARLMMNHVLLREGYMPVIVPSELAGRYLVSLERADRGDIRPLTRLFADAETGALELALRAARGQQLDDRSDVVMEAPAIYRRLPTTFLAGPREAEDAGLVRAA